MTHAQMRAMVTALFDNALIVHGKFMIGDYPNASMICGVGRGDRLVPSGSHREGVAGSIIIVPLRRVVLPEMSPEDFLEQPPSF